MNSRNREPSSAQQRLEAVIAEYLQAVQAGERPDRRRLLEENSDLSEELRSFFANDDWVKGRPSGELPTLAASSSGAPSKGRATAGKTSPTVTDPELGRDAATFAHSSEAPASSSSAASLPRAGQHFGDYELLEEISRGGMGVVYKARQVSLNRIVALKMIKSGTLASPEEVQRFHMEAEAAAKLDHPGIVPIFEIGQHRGLHFFSMGYVEGKGLDATLNAGPLPAANAASLAKKITEAVAYAHGEGVIHRDLKPANVLIDSRGEPRLTDFGLAKNLQTDSGMTASGQILGTPAFMAPEQAAGQTDDVGPLADVYSLGAILYALCTGQAPFGATNPMDTLLKVLDSEPALPSALNRAVPKSLERICLKCLEKKPSDRYASATALADDLQHFLKDEPINARPADVWQRFRRWARRQPVLASHWGGILAALTIVQTTYLMIGADWAYHLRHTYVLILWAAVSYFFQKLQNWSGREKSIRFAWAAADVVLFTSILYMAEPPRGPLLIGYPLLVTAAGLFFRVRFVVFMTVITIAGYLALVFLRPQEEAIKPHFCVLFCMALAVLGGIVATQVRRIRALTQYPGDMKANRGE